MTAWGIVVAAGSGSRFGGAKHRVRLGGIEMWERCRDTLRIGGVDEVVVVGDVPGGITGGRRRRDSVRRGLDAVPAAVEYVLVHDAARPLASAGLARAVLTRLGADDVDGVIPVVPVGDTLKTVEGSIVGSTVARDGLVAVQTPQGFRRVSLVAAHDSDDDDATDDAQLVERWGGVVATVPGDPRNLKVTYEEDLDVMRALLGEPTRDVRTGWAFDGHRFGGAPPLLLAGIAVDDSRGLVGHSDGDVAAHAVADALLGAVAAGDIGMHFPSSDERWRGADSMVILAEVAAMVRAAHTIVSLDLTIISESVRIAPYRHEMRLRLAETLGVGIDQVSVKATTTDAMGALGADEGVAAAAVAGVIPKAR